MKRYELAEFIAGLSVGSVALSSGIWVQVESPVGIPIKLLASGPRPEWRSVAFLFHGAIDQKKRSIPYFEGEFLKRIHFPETLFISFSDPALLSSPAVRAGWYAGVEDQRVPEEIATLVQSVLQALTPNRVLFFGGSVGGHAALWHSSQVPDSVCVVKNAITAISRYGVSVDSYRKYCWPNHADQTLEQLICDDVADCYREIQRNFIIYLQNATDRLVTSQMLPFLAQLRNPARLHLVSQSYPGYVGHTFPPGVVAQWVEAALKAPELRINAMVEFVEARNSGPSKKVHSSSVRDRTASEKNNPYHGLPERAFWRPAVADRHPADWENLWDPIVLSPDTVVATGGSCFAQHIGRNLRERGANYLDLEPPPSDLAVDDWPRHGYGMYSCRYGNLYTTRQLLQLMQESLGERVPVEQVWESGERFFDPYRPSVEPDGWAGPEQVLQERQEHLSRVASMWEKLDLFVFTLGLTETWISRKDGSAFPTAPGTIAGSFQPASHAFANLSYEDIYADLKAFWERLSQINRRARLLLTVSPVPLTATYRDAHVLVASTSSKATLRAVADAMVHRMKNVFYFPSFEIISTHPARGQFFNPDLRTVNTEGVRFVMRHFFADQEISLGSSEDIGAIVCDEERLEDTLAGKAEGESSCSG